MKKFLLASLLIIKNATIVIPFIEGMISALVKMIEADNKKKEKESEKLEETVKDAGFSVIQDKEILNEEVRKES